VVSTHPLQERSVPGTMSSTRSTISFGWYVVAASFVIMFLNAGARLMIGVLVKPVIADFGWSRSAVSAAVFVNMAVFSASIIITGRLYDRYGPKWIVLISSILFSGGLMLMAVMTNLWQFILFYGVISAAGLGGTTSVIFGAIVSRWFRRGRGSAISLAMSGTSLGQFALVPLFTAFLLDEGWRSTMLWVGVLCLVVNVVLVFWVIGRDPRDPGREPLGSERAAAAVPPAPDATGSSPGQAAGAPGPRSLGLREAMRTGSFWLFTVAMFVCGAGDFLLTTHLVPMATDHGVPTSTAVAMLAWFGLLSLGGILLAGPMSDLIGDKVPIAGAFALRVVLFLLVVRYQNTAAFWALSLGFGFTFLITAPLTTTLMGRMYGFASIGLLSGFITTVHHLGGGLWAYLGGAVYDATGSYNAAMAISAGASAVALVCTLLIREVRHFAPGERPGARIGDEARRAEVRPAEP
jgi:MFS family permease